MRRDTDRQRGGERERGKEEKCETKTEKERGERRKCRRACFYGCPGKIWGEGILHHRGRPMTRLG